MPSNFEAHRTATGKFQSVLINILLCKSIAIKPTGVLFVPRGAGVMERHYRRINVACEMFSGWTITFQQTPGFVARKGRFGMLTASAQIFMTSLLLSCGDIESNPGPSPDGRGDSTPLASHDDGLQDQHSCHSQPSSQLPQILYQDVMTILKDTMKRMEANQVKHADATEQKLKIVSDSIIERMRKVEESQSARCMLDIFETETNAYYL